MACNKINEALRQIEKEQPGQIWTSVEFFPPKTDAGVNSLYNVIEKLRDLDPVFLDVTWGAGGGTSDLTLELCTQIKQRFGMNPNMHLTCTNMEKQKVLDALEGCKKVGIRNIVALRGDPPAGQAAWEAVEGGFSCALDLVKFIRAEHGDFFCLSVAGYPEGHPSKMTVVTDLSSLTPSELGRCSKLVNEQGVEETYVCLDSDYEKELDYLKQKVDAGADCIITQLFFDVNVFLSFVQQCRKKGITVPIIPGIMCVSSAGGFQRMTKFCRTRVPEDLAAAAASMKEDEEMKAFGVSYITTMCEKLIESNISGLHFYTLNSSHATMEIVQNLKKKYTIRQASTPANQEDILETVFTNVEQNKMSV